MANNPVNSSETSNMGAFTGNLVNVRLGVLPVLLLLVTLSSALQDILHPDNVILDIHHKDLVSQDNISDNQVPSDFNLEI